MSNPAALRFAHFELCMVEHRLLAHGRPVALGSRAFDVLKALAQRPGQLVTKDQLLEIVWPGVAVLENNLPAQVSSLRKVLGPDIIATVSGRGYRFVAALKSDDAVAPDRATGSAVALQAPEQRTNLPKRLPAMLGRADELASLKALLDKQRVVTLVGPGGMGKSLLALHLLGSQRSAFSHGVCWVEMATVGDAAALPGVVAAALGLQLGGGDALGALAAALAPLHLLVVLDNAEHLLSDVALMVQAMHDAAPGVSLLVTSQSPLHLPVERVLRLAPLAVPDEACGSAAEARRFGALALFEERALAADPLFQLTDANTPAGIALCRALDGLPLAIELAAARLPMLGLTGLVAALHERLQVFTINANRWAPARQQTLKAMIAWSHGLLDERERVIFRRLGAVVGSASLDLVEDIVADEAVTPALDRWAVLDVLHRLVDRSLVAIVRSDDPQMPPRYRLLQSTRAYALEMLAAADELQAAGRRHSQAIAEHFAQRWRQRWDGSMGMDDWKRQIEPDLDNAREALAWAHANGDAAAALTIGMCLLQALPNSKYTERLAVGDTCNAMLAADNTLPAALRLQMLLALSALWIDTHWPRSRATTEQALAMARAEAEAGGDRFWLYLALSLSASSAARQGNLDATESALADMRAIEDPAWPAQRLINGASTEAMVAFILGKPADMLLHARKHVVLGRAAGAHGHLSMGNLVAAEVAAGEAQAALKTGAALLSQLQGTRNEHGLSYARLNMAAACLAVGDTGQVRDLARDSLPLAERFDQWSYWADYLALWAALEGRHDDAARMIGFSNRRYATKQDTRFGNEARAVERACELASRALGGTAFEWAQREGEHMLPADIAALVRESHVQHNLVSALAAG